MPLEQKQPTKSLDDRTVDILEKITVLSYLPKYPPEEKQLKFICRRLAAFVQTVDVNHSCPADPRPTDMGWVNPLDWLLDQVADTFSSYFPAPIAMRKIYEQYFTPLDGKTSSELESVIE
jgi:hypothetical protein